VAGQELGAATQRLYTYRFSRWPNLVIRCRSTSGQASDGHRITESRWSSRMRSLSPRDQIAATRVGRFNVWTRVGSTASGPPPRYSGGHGMWCVTLEDGTASGSSSPSATSWRCGRSTYPHWTLDLRCKPGFTRMDMPLTRIEGHRYDRLLHPGPAHAHLQRGRGRGRSVTPVAL